MNAVTTWWETMVEKARKVEWLYEEARAIVGGDDAITGGSSSVTDTADMIQAVVKAGDLLSAAGELPGLFWLAFVALIYAIVFTSVKLVDVWVIWVVRYFGWYAYVVLTAAVIFGWPTHFYYLVVGFRFAASVCDKHQRTVQLLGLPEKLCTHEAMVEYVRTRELQVTHVAIGARQGLEKGGLVELIFKTERGLEDAFSQGHLKVLESTGGGTVRARRKAGSYSATIDYWVMILQYFARSIPADYWLHTVISSLITISLGDDLLKYLGSVTYPLAEGLRPYLRPPSAFCAFITLASVCIFVWSQAVDSLSQARELGILSSSLKRLRAKSIRLSR